MDEHELAWAAGFFDGDGWASQVRQAGRRTGQPMARINQAGMSGVPQVLIRFRDAVGVGRVGGPKTEKGRQDLYWWVASSRGDVTRVGQLIGPWLSSQKRAQFRTAVDLQFEGDPRSSLAWAAGLFDAEGSVMLTDHRSHVGFKVIAAEITQGGDSKGSEELLRFQTMTHLGYTNGPYVQAGANKPIYRWRSRRADEIRLLMHVLFPWLGSVKRAQAISALALVGLQPALPRGRADWGSHKTHCVHGHEYATARVRAYVSRGVGVQRRDSKQCLVCARDQARAKRIASENKIGDLPAADHDDPVDRSYLLK